MNGASDDEEEEASEGKARLTDRMVDCEGLDSIAANAIGDLVDGCTDAVLFDWARLSRRQGWGGAVLSVPRKCPHCGALPCGSTVCIGCGRNFSNLPDVEVLGAGEVSWRSAALSLGESIAAQGPTGYYEMTPEQWLAWVRGVLTVRPPLSATCATCEYWSDPCPRHWEHKQWGKHWGTCGSDDYEDGREPPVTGERFFCAAWKERGPQ